MGAVCGTNRRTKRQMTARRSKSSTAYQARMEKVKETLKETKLREVDASEITSFMGVNPGKTSHLGVMTQRSGYFSSSAITQNCAILAVGKRDGWLILWDVEDWSVLGEWKAHGSHVNACAFTPGGEKLATSSIDDTLKIWTSKGVLLFEIDVKGESRAFAFSNSGEQILHGLGATNSVIYEVASGNAVLQLGNEGWLTSCVFMKDDSVFFTGNVRGEVKSWEQSGNLVESHSAHTDRITSCSISLDGTLLLTASNDKTAKVWDLKTFSVLVVLEHDDYVRSARFTSDASTIVTVTSNELVTWDVRSGTRKRQVPANNLFQHCYITPDSAFIITIGFDTIKVLHLDTCTEI